MSVAQMLVSVMGTRVSCSSVIIPTAVNRSTRRCTCSSTSLSTSSPTWTGVRSNTDFRSHRPTKNRLSHVSIRMFVHNPVTIVFSFMLLESWHNITWVPYTCCDVHFCKEMCVQMVRVSRKDAVGSEDLERAKCSPKYEYEQTAIGQCSSSKNIESSP
jgi:hypothetical protein